MKNGVVVEGIMSFFNYDKQVVHISDYRATDKDGKEVYGDFYVANGNSWHNMEAPDIKEE